MRISDERLAHWYEDLRDAWADVARLKTNEIHTPPPLPAASEPDDAESFPSRSMERRLEIQREARSHMNPRISDERLANLCWYNKNESQWLPFRAPNDGVMDGCSANELADDLIAARAEVATLQEKINQGDLRMMEQAFEVATLKEQLIEMTAQRDTALQHAKNVLGQAGLVEEQLAARDNPPHRIGGCACCARAARLIREAEYDIARQQRNISSLTDMLGEDPDRLRDRLVEAEEQLAAARREHLSDLKTGYDALHDIRGWYLEDMPAEGLEVVRQCDRKTMESAMTVLRDRMRSMGDTSRG